MDGFLVAWLGSCPLFNLDGVRQRDLIGVLCTQGQDVAEVVEGQSEEEDDDAGAPAAAIPSTLLSLDSSARSVRWHAAVNTNPLTH